MPTLELNHLRKAYSSENVPVKGISLKVEDHEFLSLVGPSGCGKSTILRLIAGLEPPTSGHVMIGGWNMNPLSAGDRNVAMVFQSYALYPHMTVYDNIASGLKIRGIPAGEVQKRVQETSRTLGIDHLLNRRPAKLSGGQRQRVALGRALVRKPDVFLLDEPLSNLDALLRERVRSELKQLFAEQPSPVVYVTHDQTEAMTLSSKVAVLFDGALQQLDTPDHVYHTPANKFVAGFIGSPQMNLWTLPCQGSYAVLGNVRIPLPATALPYGEIHLGIRPEHIYIASAERVAAAITAETFGPGTFSADALGAGALGAGGLGAGGLGSNATMAEDTAAADSRGILIRGRVFLVENLGIGQLISVRIRGAEAITLRALVPAGAQWQQANIDLILPQHRLHWFGTDRDAQRIGD